MRIGYAARDITPQPGLTLSGFAARCDQPSTGIDDPLAVHALAAESGGQRVLLLVFDLLGLGPELTARLHAALDRQPGLDLPVGQRVLCCTHTHSAPATVKLLGCGIPEPAYWDLVCQAAAAAAAAAMAALAEVTVRTPTVAVSGANYNRRRFLADGRVAMTVGPDTKIVKSGPAWDTLRLFRFDAADGRPLAGLVHWAAHPDTVCSLHVTADFPGELNRRLAQQWGCPFLFLQGPCGNLNPPFVKMNREEMLANVAGLMARLQDMRWPAATLPTAPFALRRQTVPLRYAPAMPADELRQFRAGMAEIADGGTGPAATRALIANILNVEPGAAPDPCMLRHFAGIMRDWSAGVLARPRADLPAVCDCAVAVWRLGPVAWCAIAAEVFVETALALQDAFPQLTVPVLSYAAPVVGYLPPDESMREGGYEVDYAWRFYGHHAPFAPGSEPAVRAALSALIHGTE